MTLPRLKEHDDALKSIGDACRHATTPTALMACGFAGGFGLGAMAAGFKVIGGIESAELPFGARTAQQGWNVLIEGQANWSNGKLAAKIKRELGEAPDALLMNPPCSAYAKNGKRGGMDDPVMCNLRACIDLAFSLAPNVWCWELVPGIFTDPAGREFIDALATRCASEGYAAYAFLTSSAVHGGFQNRERFHFIASKFALAFQEVLDCEPPEFRGWRPVSQALSSPLPALNNRVVPAGSLDAVLPHVPPGTYVNQVPDSVLERVYRPRGNAWVPTQGRPGVSRIRAMWDRPSATIVGGPSVVHPDEDRFITVRESARLMGFPDTWEFSEGSQGYAEVGKGLTVHTARFVSAVILNGIENEIPETPTGKLEIVDFRDLSEAPGLTSSPEFKREWYMARHGTPWEGNNRSPGRPQGGGTRKPMPSVRIASDSPEVRAKCEEFSLSCVSFAEATETDVAIIEAQGMAAAMAVVFALGGCKAKRRVLCSSIENLELPGVEIVSGVQAAIDLVAAHAAPMLRAKLARLITELPDAMLADALEFLADLTTADEEEPEELEEPAG